jgi:hypothetical protein
VVAEVSFSGVGGVVVGAADSAVGASGLLVVEESVGRDWDSECEGGDGGGCEMRRYRRGDALIRSCAADSEAKSAMNVFGVGLRGLYCQLIAVSKRK